MKKKKKKKNYQVSMQDACTMNIFQPSQDLVEEILAMFVGEGLRGLDDGCQVAFHEL